MTTVTAASRVDLEYIEGDDPSFEFTLTLDATVHDLTGSTVLLVLKSGPEQADADGTTLTSAGSTVNITAPATLGKVTVDLEQADVASPVKWYVLRVVTADERVKTFGYGNMKPINV